MSAWWGFDLDGTLAVYTKWKGPGHIGEAIKPTVRRIRYLLRKRRDVRIFTARVWVPERPQFVYDMDNSVTGPEAQAWIDATANAEKSRTAIDAFTLRHFGKTLPITCEKDYQTLEIYDDRAKQVYPNTGELVERRVRDLENMLKALLIFDGGVWCPTELQREAEDLLSKPKGYEYES